MACQPFRFDIERVRDRSMKADVAIIGGTGVGELLAELPGQIIHVPTPEGTMRGRVTSVKGKKLVLVQRHSGGHKVSPHQVNVKAIALGLRQLGVRACLATAAVGSLRLDLDLGLVAPCTDFIDATGRNWTLFDGVPHHTPMSFGATLPYNALESGSLQANERVPERLVYLSTNGPRYETTAEIHAYQTAGADVVGMTAASEAVLMTEAGIPYGCLAIVTNFAQGLTDVVPNHEEVVELMHRKGKTAVEILLAASEAL